MSERQVDLDDRPSKGGREKAGRTSDKCRLGCSSNRSGVHDVDRREPHLRPRVKHDPPPSHLRDQRAALRRVGVKMARHDLAPTSGHALPERFLNTRRIECFGKRRRRQRGEKSEAKGRAARVTHGGRKQPGIRGRHLTLRSPRHRPRRGPSACALRASPGAPRTHRTHRSFASRQARSWGRTARS